MVGTRRGGGSLGARSLQRGRALGAILAALLVLFASINFWVVPTVTASSPGLTGDFTTLDEVQADASLDLIASQGALRVSPIEHPALVQLQAEEVQVTVEWERGIEPSPSRDSARLKQATDHGSETRAFENATLWLPEVATGDSVPELLAFEDLLPGRAEFSVTTGAPGTLGLVEDMMIMAAGSSPGNVQAGEDRTAGFWYVADEHWLAAAGPGSGEVRGSFTLFVNNVTVQVESPEGSWETWAGYRTTDEEGLGLTRYEQRVVLIEVTGGAFSVGAQRGLGLFGPAVAGSVDGTLLVPDATGSIKAGDRSIQLARDTIELRGSGQLAVQAVQRSSGTGSGDGESEPAVMHLEPAGRFEVSQEGVRLIEPSPGGWLLWDGPEMGLLGGGVLLLLLAGVLAVPPARRRCLGVATGVRAHGFERALSRGWRLEERGAFAPAARAYRVAATLGPERIIAWYHLARTRIELGDHPSALACLDESLARTGVEPTDCLELRVVALDAMGEIERAAAHLSELAARDPAGTRAFVEDVGLEALAAEAGLPGIVQPGEPGVGLGWEGGIDGYA